jgi:hypothetical protein
VKDELEWMLKEVVVAYFKVLAESLSGGTEEYCVKLQSR